MKGWSNFGAIILVLCTIATSQAQSNVASQQSSSANAQSKASGAETTPVSNVAPLQSSKAIAADLAAASREYKSSSDAVIRLQEEEIEQASDKLEQLRQLVTDGLVAKIELEASEHALIALKAKLAATRQSIADSERQAIDNKAAAELVKAQAAQTAKNSAKIKTLVTRTMLRYNGSTSWSLAGLSGVQQFFSTRFGRALPTSAVGQSSTHNRLGYDHRHAVDVALHPDSAEGKALIDYLRGNGIPFLAFRSAVPGVATGPHIHIGTPSHRLA